ncbi:MAG TPA: Gfo/Idh/MocA family oxidoreductase [Myxococcota bacterium]
MSDSQDFALLGAAGYVAPRHLKAIADTGNELVAACDPSDSVGILDRHFPHARFFTEVERFDRHLEKRRIDGKQLGYMSICTPNYLHDAHVRLALRLGAHAICEKPLVVSPWNLDQLAALEERYDRRVYTILQLRLLPQLQRLRDAVRSSGERHDVQLSYITPRGPWYSASWKGDVSRSGGLAVNIGIHLFDALLWIFGPLEWVQLTDPRFGAYTLEAIEAGIVDPEGEPERSSQTIRGIMMLERATVNFTLSTDRCLLPKGWDEPALRRMKCDGQTVDFSSGFTDLHTRAYEDILAGHGFGIEDARGAIELAYRVRELNGGTKT